MTSGNFAYVSVSSIIVDRENRQRRELTGIDELAASIKRNGLINPIVVTQDLILVAGERRFTAHQQLGYDQIAVQYAEDLDETELQMIELEENIKRVDLSWQDQVRSIAKFEALKRDANSDWNNDDTADELNMSRTNVRRYMMVNKYLEEGVPEVVEAPKLSQAVSFSLRKAERQKTSTMRDLLDVSPTNAGHAGGPIITDDDVIAGAENDATRAAKTRFADVLHADFTKWSEQIQGVPYNLVHCDFPYGVNAGDTKGQSGAAGYGHYEDKPEVYFNLISTFLKNQNNFIGPSAHLIFWYSLDFHDETVALFRGAGWVVNPFPLIWFKSDNTGILPDANRGPRRVYETALFMTRGDRKVVRAVGNCTPCGVSKEYHVSEKPKKMLEHFLRMLVDETTVMLDPTAGSGNAVYVAEQLGASWSLGLERDEEFATRARENLGLD
jgi:ParB family chromosome partitioning protein